MSSSSSSSATDLIPVSPALLATAMLPLFAIAGVSHRLGLRLERSVIVGTLRAAAQLTACGYVLKPIFLYGARPSLADLGWLLVAAYALFMLVLASWESSRRSRYYFDGIFPCILTSFLFNVGWVSIFAFGLIIQPDPLWSPKYVIPITGMLLGNCINGVSLALNSILTSLKEKAAEIELLLSFGATIYEATADLLREGVRVGAMPIVNGMSVIGVVSLPGMMTGQILGGSPVVEAARYQILITYLIAACAFGTILSELWLARRACCDVSRQRLRPEKLKLRSAEDRQQKSVFYLALRWLRKDRKEEEEMDGLLIRQQKFETEEESKLFPSTFSQSGQSSSTAYGTESGNAIELFTMRRGNTDSSAVHPATPTLEMRRVSRSFRDSIGAKKSFLFRNISLSVNAGDVVAVSGPSGTGKSQLLRVIAGLSPMHNEDDVASLSDLLLMGKSSKTFPNQADWRRQVRYVSQYKIDIPGTPRIFMKRISTLSAWQRHRKQRINNQQNDMPPSFEAMIQSASEFVSAWGLDASSCLDQEWKTLSGGESQRVYVAICLASRPKVLLMDESTSSLDSYSKQQLEQSVLETASRRGVSVVWISHDNDQIERMTSSG